MKIVYEDELAVPRPLNIALNTIEAGIECILKRFKGVFGTRSPYPAMTDEERPLAIDSREFPRLPKRTVPKEQQDRQTDDIE